MSPRLLVIGDALLDRDLEGRSERLAPDAPVPVVDQHGSRVRPGGGGLAACLLATAGVPVTLVTATAPDPAGSELRRALLGAGVDLLDVGLDGATPEKIRVFDRRRQLLRLDRGGGGAVGSRLPIAALQAVIDDAGAILVSDYGRGLTAVPEIREALEARPANLPLVWDPHPRGAPPVARTTLATPNLPEATAFAGRPAGEGTGAEQLGAELVRRWGCEAVCVTRGAEGALLVGADGEVYACGTGRCEGDPCGAGDRFATELAAVLADGGNRYEAIWAAVVAAAEFVAAGGAAAALAPGERLLEDALAQRVGVAPVSIEPALRLAARVRGEGGTVVATGGCFDLLHVGHLHTLEGARALGDCLVVLLNSDRSVRGLKGPERPVVGELERAALLEGLACVDEVAIFDEQTPVEALRLLRPEVWAKGGDYAVDELGERVTLASWGGRTVVLPYLDGRSTTKLIEKAGNE